MNTELFIIFSAVADDNYFILGTPFFQIKIEDVNNEHFTMNLKKTI